MQFVDSGSRACGAPVETGGGRTHHKRRRSTSMTQLGWRILRHTQRWLSANINNPAAGWPRKKSA